VRLLKRLKLGQVLPTLSERLTLARAQQLDYAAFLTLLLADEVQRRDQQALERHLQQAGFEDRINLDAVDWTSPVTRISVGKRHVSASIAFTLRACCLSLGDHPVRDRSRFVRF
jgi:hypothetical protein